MPSRHRGSTLFYPKDNFASPLSPLLYRHRRDLYVIGGGVAKRPRRLTQKRHSRGNTKKSMNRGAYEWQPNRQRHRRRQRRFCRRSRRRRLIFSTSKQPAARSAPVRKSSAKENG